MNEGLRMERNPIIILELNLDATVYQQAPILDYGRQQSPIRSQETSEKIGVAFRMSTTIDTPAGRYLMYTAQLEYFISPISALNEKLFIDLIKQAEIIYKQDFNNRSSVVPKFVLELPVLDELEAAKQYKEFCEQ